MKFFCSRPGLWKSKGPSGYTLTRYWYGSGPFRRFRWYVRYPERWMARLSYASLAAARRHALKRHKAGAPPVAFI